ncbi:MAG: tripartite tricarboxylate transporter substrate binding protein [Betaproteobacteria bacterium]|nr:tripartite tricarboxylate transporter substrate binding protein [Betaproteobacteria bacterium]
MARIVADAISKNVGQQVVVDNRPGANAIVGMELLSKATPDGYTLVMTSSTQAVNATLYPKLPYDSVKSFAPVSLVASTPFIVAVYPALPINTISDLISVAKEKPGQLMYPSAGTGNSTHLVGELFSAMAGVNLLHVPYKGSGPGIIDLIAGRMSVIFITMPGAIPHINSRRVRAIAVTSSKRSSIMPDLPTVSESGLPGYEASTWYGILAPAGTPRRIVMALNSEIVKVLGTPEVKKGLYVQGLDPIGNTPEQFAAYVQSEIDKWAKVIKASGVKLE